MNEKGKTLEQRVTNHGAWLDGLEIGEAVGVLARGMSDNPIHIAAFGENPERRLQRLCRIGGASNVIGWQRAHAGRAEREQQDRGRCGHDPPASAGRAPGSNFASAPPARQRFSVGRTHGDLAGSLGETRPQRALLALRTSGSVDTYLETDKPENVLFYE